MGLAAAAVILGGAWAATHPTVETGFDLNEIPLAQALWSVGAVLMLLRPSPRLDWLDRLPALRRLVTVLNARALTIYLWHKIAIDLDVPIDDRFGLYMLFEQFGTAMLLVFVPSSLSAGSRTSQRADDPN